MRRCRASRAASAPLDGSRLPVSPFSAHSVVSARPTHHFAPSQTARAYTERPPIEPSAAPSLFARLDCPALRLGSVVSEVGERPFPAHRAGRASGGALGSRSRRTFDRSATRAPGPPWNSDALAALSGCRGLLGRRSSSESDPRAARARIHQDTQAGRGARSRASRIHRARRARSASLHTPTSSRPGTLRGSAASPSTVDLPN